MRGARTAAAFIFGKEPRDFIVNSLRKHRSKLPLFLCGIFLALSVSISALTDNPVLALATIPAGALAMVCVVTWATFHTGLNRRIDELVKATERLAAGEAVEEIPADSTELAKLTAAFHQMSQKISRSTAELREANERMKLEIAERKSVEEALRNSERRFRSVWENSLEPLRLTDACGTVVAANPAYCRLMEKNLAEVLNQPYTEVYELDGGEDKLARYMQQFSSRTLDRYQTKTVTLRSGRKLAIEVSYSFIDMEGERPLLLGVFRDVTEQQQEEERRLALERKLLDAQKLESLGVLAGGIAHDFNNLLAAILGNTNLAQMQVPESEVKLTAFLKSIEKASMRAADLCKQMLAYSGKGRFAMRVLDVNEVVRETLELLEVSITKKAALRVELRHGVPGVRADSTQLRQVIMNLVINASEAIGEQSGLIRVRTGVVKADEEYFGDAYAPTELAPGDYVFVEVSDTGCGMTPETQKKIFDPFFTTKFTGRGLGLAAVLGIVRGHKGALKLTSEPEKGSTFRFLLPLASTPVESETTRIIRAIDGWKAEGTILIVDDDPTVRAVMARMAECVGLKVLQAVDGRHGVEVFGEKNEEICAAIVDMTMPNLDGREALQRMRKIRGDLRVLMVSGFSEHSNGNSNGCTPNAFLQKPFKNDEFISKLRRLLTKQPETAPALAAESASGQ
jgi:two-component system, cell cycle sensor histidine kinase and response regulator CckA